MPTILKRQLISRTASQVWKYQDHSLLLKPYSVLPSVDELMLKRLMLVSSAVWTYMRKENGFDYAYVVRRNIFLGPCSERMLPFWLRWLEWVEPASPVEYITSRIETHLSRRFSASSLKVFTQSFLHRAQSKYRGREDARWLLIIYFKIENLTYKTTFSTICITRIRKIANYY